VSVNVSNFSVHIETIKVLLPSEISVLQRVCYSVCVTACVLQRVLQRSKPEVFQILNVGGQTLRLNLFDVHEF